MTFLEYCSEYENDIEDAWVESKRDGTKEAFMFKLYEAIKDGE